MVSHPQNIPGYSLTTYLTCIPASTFHRLKTNGLQFRCVIDIAVFLTWRKCFLRRLGRCSAHLYVFGDFFPEVLNPLLVILYDRLDLLLQFLAMGNLLVYKQLHFVPVANTAVFRFAFVLFPDFGIFSSDPKPNALEALR